MENKVNFEISETDQGTFLKTQIKTETGTFKPKGVFELDIRGPHIIKFPVKITYDNDKFEEELDHILQIIKIAIMNSKDMIDAEDA